ncbi:hypothetical protein MTO96_037496 [Rhipicephalus appendiculatus]
MIPHLRYFVTLRGHSDPERPEPRGSVAGPNASSARQPLRLGMATGTLGAFEATTTSRHGETAPAENIDLTGPGSSVLDGRHDEISGRSRQNNEERPQTDDDWQTVLTLRQKKQQARERKRGTDSTGSTSPTKPHQRRRRTPELPPLPKEDFKIVLRPHQGLPLKTISTPALAEAIVTACSNEIRGVQNVPCKGTSDGRLSPARLEPVAALVDSETQWTDIHVNLSVLRAGVPTSPGIGAANDALSDRDHLKINNASTSLKMQQSTHAGSLLKMRSWHSPKARTANSVVNRKGQDCNPLDKQMPGSSQRQPAKADPTLAHEGTPNKYGHRHFQLGYHRRRGPPLLQRQHSR